MPIVLALSVLLNVALILLGVWALQKKYLLVETPALDTAAVALAAATVSLTLIGTIIAIVAFVGYREIKRSARDVAKQEATAVADRVTREVASPLVLRGIMEALTTAPAEAALDAQNLANAMGAQEQQ